jgi:hypothetical protein
LDRGDKPIERLVPRLHSPYKREGGNYHLRPHTPSQDSLVSWRFGLYIKKKHRGKKAGKKSYMKHA